MPEAVAEFVSIFSALADHGKKNIKAQVSQLLFTINGGIYVLDSGMRVEEPLHFDICTCSDRPSVQRKTFQTAADLTFQWLLSECNLSRADNHRFLFGLNDEGLLHCSKHFSTYLMIANVSESTTLTENISGKTSETDVKLIVAKIAHDKEGLEILGREARNLHKLQFTNRVAELWDPKNYHKHLEHGALLTLYYPATLEQDFNMCMRKEDIEMLALELLSTLDLLHQNGWIWNGLRTGHYLYNLLRHDDRDVPTPLRAIGLEEAQYVGTHDSITTRKALNEEKGWRARESSLEDIIPACKAGDMHSMGLLLLSMCSRNPRIQSQKYSHGLSQEHKTEVITAHNKLVFDSSKLLGYDDWIINLTDLLLKARSAKGSSASEALKYIKSQIQITDPRPLVLGEVSQKFIPGYLDQYTGRFVWPVTVHTTVVQDIRVSHRLTKEVTLKASFKMEAGVIAAKYGGRPIQKRCATWLQMLGLQTHTVSDGADGALDGRREGNGIFDLSYFESTRQVRESMYRNCLLERNKGFNQ